jgi:hypothetical protein
MRMEKTFMGLEAIYFGRRDQTFRRELLLQYTLYLLCRGEYHKDDLLRTEGLNLEA